MDWTLLVQAIIGSFVELRGGPLIRIRAYFAPDFDPPDWRAPFREAP